MSAANTELLSCPFCGGEAEMLTAESMNGGYLFGIMCNDCPEADHGSIWVDTVYCRWWRENIGAPGEQMRLGV